jgi:hypothetical protein
VHGPLLVHDRIDYGFAVLSYYLVNLWSRKPRPLRKFLPPWQAGAEQDPLEGFRQLFDIAEQNADNLNADR